MNYFPEPHTHGKNKVEVELALVNYATKFDLKNATSADTSDFFKKTDLASLKSYTDKLEKAPSGLSNSKSKVDKLVVDKLVRVPFDLKKLSDLVDKEVAKEMCMTNWLKKLMLFKLLIIGI